MAITSNGTTFSYGGTAIADVVSISGPNVSVATIDTTNMAGLYRTFIGGKIDSGEVSLEIHYDPNLPTAFEDVWDNTAAAVPAAVECIITFSDSSTYTFQGFLTSFEPSVALDDSVKASITVKVTAGVTVATS